MIMRVWRLIVSLLSRLIGRAEKKNAGAIRERIIDERVQEVAQAERGLGELAGAVREQTREVERLEGEEAQLKRRKKHFLAQVQAAEPDSAAASAAKAQALEQHRALATAIADLNAARQELQRLIREFEASKGLVLQARGDVKAAKKKGKELERRQRAAGRREQLVRTTSSLRGLGGISDDLASLDEEIENSISNMEGAALVAAELASHELAERDLDLQIARQETDAEFEAELAALEAEKPALPAETPKETLEVPPASEVEAVPVRTSPATAASFGSSDFGSTDFGSDDTGSSSE